MENLKEFIKKPIGIGVIVIVVGIIILGMILVIQPGEKDIGLDDQVRVRHGDQETIIHKNGQIDFLGNQPFSQKWLGKNGETLYGYFQNRIAQNEYSDFTQADCYLLSFTDETGDHTVCLSESIELVSLFDSFDDPSGGGGGGSSIDDYFDDGDDGDGDTGGGNGGDDNGGGGDNGDDGGGGGAGTPTPTPDDDCPYWRLSYCVYPNPTPPPVTPTPDPGEVLPPDCGYNTLTGKTVISGELCISD